MTETGRQDGVARHPEDCRRVAEVLCRIFGDKWTALILVELGYKRLRFKELHRAVSGISQRMLTVTLRNLERDGLVARTVYPTVPPRVEYELSEHGRSLRAVLELMGGWVRANRLVIEDSRRRFDESAGAKSEATLIRQ